MSERIDIPLYASGEPAVRVIVLTDQTLTVRWIKFDGSTVLEQTLTCPDPTTPDPPKSASGAATG